MGLLVSGRVMTAVALLGNQALERTVTAWWHERASGHMTGPLARRGDASYPSKYASVGDVSPIISPTHVTGRMRP